MQRIQTPTKILTGILHLLVKSAFSLSSLRHMPTRYRLNEPDVSAEVFDEEVLAINLKSGHYHSLRGLGVSLWQGLMEGFSTEELVSSMVARFPECADTAASETVAYVAQLEAASLIVPSTDSAPPSTTPGVPTTGTPYASPVVESYTDMQELLLIDPIHEVDVYTGWPQKPAS